MIQFNLQRFIKLARWTLTVDKKYHIKSFFQNLVIFTLVFVFFTSITFTVSQQAANYLPCSITAIVAFAVTLVLGSSFMFYSMSGKHDMQRLLMLPASNLEKYLMRYASWIILLLDTVCVWSGGGSRTGETGDQCRHRILPERHASVIPHELCMALRVAAFALCRWGDLLPLPQEQLDSDESGGHRGRHVAISHSRPLAERQYVLVE